MLLNVSLWCAVLKSSSIRASAFGSATSSSSATSVSVVSNRAIATSTSQATSSTTSTALGMAQQRGLEQRQEGASPMGEHRKISHRIVSHRIHTYITHGSNSVVRTVFDWWSHSFIHSSIAGSVEVFSGSLLHRDADHCPFSVSSVRLHTFHYISLYDTY